MEKIKSRELCFTILLPFLQDHFAQTGKRVELMCDISHVYLRCLNVGIGLHGDGVAC